MYSKVIHSHRCLLCFWLVWHEILEMHDRRWIINGGIIWKPMLLCMMYWTIVRSDKMAKKMTLTCVTKQKGWSAKVYQEGHDSGMIYRHDRCFWQRGWFCYRWIKQVAPLYIVALASVHRHRCASSCISFTSNRIVTVRQLAKKS